MRFYASDKLLFGCESIAIDSSVSLFIKTFMLAQFHGMNGKKSYYH